MINLKLNKLSSIILGYYILMVLYWVGLRLLGPEDVNSPIYLFYSFADNTMVFLGGVFGVLVSRRWGGTKSALGRGILFMGLGLISWGLLAGYIWSFYNFFLDQEVPYPSIADFGCVAAIPLWMIGMFNLAKATGVKYGLRNVRGKVYLLVAPILAFAVSYYLLVTVARDGVVTDGGSALKIFFDFAYPLGDVIIITTALLIYGLTLKLLGGIYKWPVNITLLGFVVMFFADMAFSYSTTVETYYNGNYADLLFATALFLVSFGLASFKSPAGVSSSSASSTTGQGVTPVASGVDAPGVNNG